MDTVPRSAPLIGGYLFHGATFAGPYRYLRIAITIRGSHRRLVPLLAHELQHAIEIAQSSSARSAAAISKMFRERAIELGCGETDCYETQAALDVQFTVDREFKAARAAK